MKSSATTGTSLEGLLNSYLQSFVEDTSSGKFLQTVTANGMTTGWLRTFDKNDLASMIDFLFSLYYVAYDKLADKSDASIFAYVLSKLQPIYTQEFNRFWRGF